MQDPDEATLDLSSLPPIYVLPTHLTTDELHVLEDQIQDYGGDLTYDISEARVVLGKVGTRKRAQFELRLRKFQVEEILLQTGLDSESNAPARKGSKQQDTQDVKRQYVVINDSTTDDEEGDTKRRKTGAGTPNTSNETKDVKNIIRIVKMEWFHDCISQRRVLDLDKYTIYQARQVAPSDPSKTPPRRVRSAAKQFSPKTSPKSQQTLAERPLGSSILERAKADAGISTSRQDPHHMAAPHGARSMGRPGKTPVFQRSASPKASLHLVPMTTEEYEIGSDMDFPPPPPWVRNRVRYACERKTPKDSPNEAFIQELDKIRLARILTADEIGVRAYSTSMAAIAAYPYKIVSPKEILRLPGCEVKVANLWIEWRNSGGTIRAADEAQNDPTLQNLRLFYDIWGVGATTAREFYFDKGWRDLDDVVEYGWNELSRVQQIGVKYYDEFKQRIPRSEVEFIAAKVHEHAVKVRDGGIEHIVVGGYRRGKAESGDVDMIVSHRHFEKTAALVQDIVESLEQEGWITHTLTLSLTSTHRDQSTLPFKAAGVASHGAGFDTLDKALVVWQDPSWPTREEDLAENPHAKNPNVHRRVDIIISPWRTVGCAVMGWTAGTTFERDLRRYARSVKGWKFDSSGVRDRKTGEVVELEGSDGVDGSMSDAERAVFDGFGLEYREPWDRCTW